MANRHADFMNERIRILIALMLYHDHMLFTVAHLATVTSKLGKR